MSQSLTLQEALQQGGVLDATGLTAADFLEQAQAQLAGQGNQASYTTLVADVSGVVTAVDAEPGQVLASGAPVLRLAHDGPRDVVFSVPEDKVAMIKSGSKVEVRVWASKTVVEGTVREVAASADPVTRTFTVKVALDGKDALPLGTTVSVVPKSLDRGAVQVIKLPTTALLKSGSGSSVWVLDTASMTVKSQPVVVATADGNDAVITQGLTPGMQVVVAGVHVLSPGQKVTVYQPKGAVAPVESAPAAMDSVAPAAAAASAAVAK